ncbi:7TM GPCR, serpentine receptor class e (Sre) family-containing protein [Strongyloides ratti]|uniref:7TM GPCR, serpentine receptor class e (Sre) family-containing protein n=1 Tax=Strongyloides ratti TaxID=34506 RepID=A0A090KZ63_STRRB|nr:7TM GPCR, serpentine receptor class e (Sre) family-containing protein [Strongyloides ratti]CEF62686.1 7TM GPCR, serpentine receptor class e (Sre) family-containing protein [Strongyloides ratti]
MAGVLKFVYNVVLIIIDIPFISFIIILRILNVKLRKTEKNIVCSLSEKFQITENIKLTGVCVTLISIIFSVTIITNINNSLGNSVVLYQDRVNIGYLVKHVFFFIALILTIRDYKKLFAKDTTFKITNKNESDTQKNNPTIIMKNTEQDQYFEIFNKQHDKALKKKKQAT